MTSARPLSLSHLVPIGILWIACGGGWADEPTPNEALYARPEQFGAVADDPLDDYMAITNTLQVFGELRLGPGTYWTSRRVQLRSGQRFSGAGMDSTRLRLLDNSADYAAARPGSKYWVIGTWGPDTADCQVSDLTVDGNLSGQTLGNHAHTMHCVALEGYGHRLERVRAIGFGYGAYTGIYQECFPLFLSDGSGRSPQWGHHLAIIGCEVTGPALSYRRPVGGDISCILVWAAYGSGELRGNHVHDLEPDAVNRPSQIHALTGYGNNVRIISNVVERVFGSGVYADSWTNQNLTIESNIFHRVWRGVWLAGTAPVVYSNIVIRGNSFHSYDGDLRPVLRFGPLASTQELLSPALYVTGVPAIRKLSFLHNTCTSGSRWNTVATNSSGGPVIYFQATSDAARHWNEIQIHSNSISLAPLDPSARPGEGVFLWREARFCRTNRLHVLGNQTTDGTPLGLTAVDAAQQTQFILNHTPEP